MEVNPVEEEAVVVASSGKKATVKLVRSAACDRCEYGCGVAFGNKSGNELEVQVDNPIGAKSGERVALEMGDREVFFASFMVYLFPLIFMFLGYYAFSFFGRAWYGNDSELIGMLGALIFLVTSFLGLRKLDNFLGGRESFQPKITRVIDKDYFSSRACQEEIDETDKD